MILPHLGHVATLTSEILVFKKLQHLKAWQEQTKHACMYWRDYDSSQWASRPTSSTRPAPQSHHSTCRI